MKTPMTIMKKLTVIMILGALLALASETAVAQSGYDLFQQALVKERANGQIQEAIQLYQRIVNEYARDRALAAKALVQMGRAYETLGRREAQQAYERVLRDYTDQQEQVAIARARLAAITQPVSSSSESGVVVRQVWAGPEQVDIMGAPSPDGRYLSFVDWTTGDLAVRDLATGETRHLTNKGSWRESTAYAEFSTVSPDGKQVAYTWFGDDFLHDLRVVDLDGSEPRVIYRNEEVDFISPSAWSPDGRQILAQFTMRDRTQQIVMVSVADGSVRVLKTLLDWRPPGKMSLSPDGRYVAYDFPPQEDSEDRDIFLLATDGSRETPLIEHVGNDLFPVWAPDGKRIVFASDRTGSMGAWVIQVGEGKPQGSPEMLKADVGRIFPMGFTRKGSYYYGVMTGMTDVYVARLDPATGKFLDPPRVATERFLGANISPDWSRDGKYLAFVSYRGSLASPFPYEGKPGIIVIRSIETGEQRELRLKLTDYYALHPRWSPDGSSFLVVGNDEKGRRGIYRVDAQTGDVTAIVQSDPGVYIGQAMWSSDGRAVFYFYMGFPSPSRQVIVRRDIETGQELELYNGNPSSSVVPYMALSPDGRQLAFPVVDRGTGSSVLMVAPVTGGQPRQVWKGHIHHNAGLAWTSDGREILFRRRNEDVSLGSTQLWRISAEGGEPQRLVLAVDNLNNIPAMHPDGQRIAFNAGKLKAEIWVMENLLPQPSGGR